MKQFFVGLFVALTCVLAQAQVNVVPLYATALSQGTGDWNNTVIPPTFNGVTENSVPEQWSFQALVDVQYTGTTTLKLIGDAAIIPGSGRVPRSSKAYTTISTTGLVNATPTLLSSTPGGAPFTVFLSPGVYPGYLDVGLTTPVPTDVYGNAIDPSTATFNPDGTVATAGTMYTNCPSCANLPNYSMPCISDGVTVYAADCESDPNTYYGPPIGTYVQTCGTPQSTDPTSGEPVQNYQACTPTWSGGPPSIQHYTYLTGAYTAGAPVIDPATGNPLMLNCVPTTGGAGLYPVCTWSGALPVGFYLMTGTGTNEHCGSNGCTDDQESTLQYPVTTPPAPPPPPPPPPTCPPSCGDD